MIGTVPVGGGAPVAVVSMASSWPADVNATEAQIAELSGAGCEMVSLAVRSQCDADALSRVVRKVEIPVIADVGLRHRYVLAAVDAGCAAVRVVPSSTRDAFGGSEATDEVGVIARAIASSGIPLQISVGAGVSDPCASAWDCGTLPSTLAEWALWGCSRFAEQRLTDIEISVTHHDPVALIGACRLLTGRCDYPLHLCVTEAPSLPGTVNAAVAFGVLLAEGIGDSIQVSSSAPPVDEVKVCVQILRSLGLREHGREPCPTGASDNCADGEQTLTPRQVEVVRLAVLGLTAKETARRLGISKNTVDEHLRDARLRVGAATKPQLIGWAVGCGIVAHGRA